MRDDESSRIGRAVCSDDGSGQASQSTRGLSRARAVSSTGPQSRHLFFQLCRPLIGCDRLGSRLLELDGEAIGALPLALEIRSGVGCRCFEPRDLRLARLDL